jgi:hypothetical protein
MPVKDVEPPQHAACSACTTPQPDLGKSGTIVVAEDSPGPKAKIRLLEKKSL